MAQQTIADDLKILRQRNAKWFDHDSDFEMACSKKSWIRLARSKTKVGPYITTLPVKTSLCEAKSSWAFSKRVAFGALDEGSVQWSCLQVGPAVGTIARILVHEAVAILAADLCDLIVEPGRVSRRETIFPLLGRRFFPSSLLRNMFLW